MILNRLSTQDYADHRSRSGYIFRHSIMALTCGPLVYVRNLKCASTFFYQNFMHRWKWDEINWQDIDWSSQHVFGHIMDPVERRHKGLTEFITMNHCEDLFKNSEQFQQFIKHAPVFDQHTASYHDTFGNLVYHIDWIPISGFTTHQVVQFTESLLRQAGLKTLLNWDYGWAHSSPRDKKDLTDQIKQLYESTDVPEWLNLYLHNDVELYKRIEKKFDPNGGTWDQMSWLRV